MFLFVIIGGLAVLVTALLLKFDQHGTIWALR